MADARRANYMLIFVILAVIILVGQVVSLIILLRTPAKIASNVDKLEQTTKTLDSKLKTIEDLNTRVSSIESNIIVLTNKYPPNQTINVNNMNQEDFNRAVNNAVNLQFENVKWKINLNFALNIVFGSLISISFIVYLFGRKK